VRTISSSAPPPGGPPRASTAERLIQAVEALLSQRAGLDVSLREITTAAGANVAAVNYHFGSKDALITAVIARALTEHARQQLLALQAVRARREISLEDVVRAWIGPSLRPPAASRTSLISRIAARVISGGSAELRDLGVRTHAEVYELVAALLADRLPALTRPELTFRITLAATSVAGLIIRPFDGYAVAGEQLGPLGEDTLDWSVAFIMAGLSAPPGLVRPGLEPGVVEPAPEQLAGEDDPADADQP
jgi:AcrR family transcriptional regulator